jgi:hypothetical protein
MGDDNTKRKKRKRGEGKKQIRFSLVEVHAVCAPSE